MSKALRAIVVLAAAGAVCTVAVGTASASQSDAGSFAARASSAGLTTGQIKVLQNEVDAFIAEDGGTQVAINKVDFTGGSILFVVPGQTYAQEVGAGPSAVTTGETCPYQYFCAYHGTNYTGTAIELTQCGVWTLMPWTVTGSWKNDQTPGTSAYFDMTNGTVYRTPGAWSGDTSYNWAPVLAIEACA